MTPFDLWFAVWLALWVLWFALLVPFSRRTIVAYTTFFSFMRQRQHWNRDSLSHFWMLTKLSANHGMEGLEAHIAEQIREAEREQDQ
jgi:hypothetical protein